MTVITTKTAVLISLLFLSLFIFPVSADFNWSNPGYCPAYGEPPSNGLDSSLFTNLGMNDLVGTGDRFLTVWNRPTGGSWDGGYATNLPKTFTAANNTDIGIKWNWPGVGYVLCYWRWTTIESVITPVASYSVNVSSNTAYPPVSVLFTDTSTNTPTSWLWKINGISNGTLSTMSYNFQNSGTYIVNVTVTNSAGSDTYSSGYIVKGYSAPVSSMTMNVTSGNAPMAVLFTDTSTNSPTSYNTQIWDSMGVYEYHVNASAVFTYTFINSGTYKAIHTVSNPAGSDQITYQNITVIGIVPSPTPTPSIPFPNQTGVCHNSFITLGSNDVKDYDRYYDIDTPDGRHISHWYRIGIVAADSGLIYTTKDGQYFYHQYNESHQLEYQQSWVVVDCGSPAPTIAPNPTINVSVIQTYRTYVPGTTINVSATPGVVNTYVPPSNISTIIIPAVSIPNLTEIRDILEGWEPATKYYLDFIDDLMYSLNDMLIKPLLSIAIGILLSIRALYQFPLSVFMATFEGFLYVLNLYSYVITMIVNTFPNKLIMMIQALLALEILLQVIALKRGDYL